MLPKKTWMNFIRHIKSGINLIRIKCKKPAIYHDCIYYNPYATEYPESKCSMRYYIPLMIRPTCPYVGNYGYNPSTAFIDIRHFICGSITRIYIYSNILPISILQLYILHNVFLLGRHYYQSMSYYRGKPHKPIDEIKFHGV